MRCDESDKADDASGGRDGPHGHGRYQHGDALDPLHVNAEQGRLRFAQCNRVERPGQSHSCDHRKANDPAHKRDRAPTRAAQTTEQPKLDIAQLLVGRHKVQKSQARASQRVDRNARQQHQADAGATFRLGQQVDDSRHRQPADKGRHHQRPAA